MITTNLPDLVRQLTKLGDVKVHDTMDNIELRLEKKIDLHEVDDLVCDALFADPLGRQEDMHGWTVRLAKRDHLRSTSDMQVVKHAHGQNYGQVEYFA